ncbi:MAG: hypothetical protein COB60_00895 [Flavobacteriaceae bacterium]|nr:MAG: hypothetical protein COB60_00895 [Flavobacteriaceae bacterium]
MLMFSACEPIVDEEVLMNTMDVSGVELVATQSTVGGNEITLQMVTPGITGYWDYNLGKALTDRFTFIYPIPGQSTFTYTGTLGAEFFTKTIDVQIDQLDHRLEQDWYNLVSENTVEGKTWVFDGTGGDKGFWWYMCPPNEPEAWESAWWNAGGDGDSPIDATGKMKFDLNGAGNFTYYAKPGAVAETGSFVLDIANQMLKINGVNILGAEEPRGNPDGLYTIISLTEDKMILYMPKNAGGTGWVWVFKPE